GSDGLFQILHFAEKADGRDARRAAPQRFLIIREVDSADGQHRRFYRLQYFGENVEAQRGAERSLRGRIVNRPADNEVSASVLSRFSFGDRVRRDSDQKIIKACFRRDGANLAGRDRRGAQVNSVRARGPRQVETVVDQHGGAVRPRVFDGRASECGELLRAHIFLANLNELAAGPSRFTDHFELQSRQVVVMNVSAAEEGQSVGYQI